MSTHSFKSLQFEPVTGVVQAGSTMVSKKNNTLPPRILLDPTAQDKKTNQSTTTTKKKTTNIRPTPSTGYAASKACATLFSFCYIFSFVLIHQPSNVSSIIHPFTHSFLGFVSSSGWSRPSYRSYWFLFSHKKG